MSLRRPTSRDAANATVTPYTGTGSTRNCMTCNKWRPQAGGRIHPRTGLWQCHGCRPATADKPEAVPCES